MTEVLLGEIARAPTNELLECRESYSLTAGLALGMLCLGRGSDAAGLADLRLEDQLGSYMHGRDSALPWPVRGVPRAGERPAVNRCCRIREGPLINVDVTAAGATLALGLTFLQTNNTAVAAQLRLPQSMYMLSCVRPDLIALRVIARNLILWDHVQPSAEWLNAQMPLHGAPLPVSDNSIDDGADAEAQQALRLAKINATGGACLALGLRFAGSGCASACALLTRQLTALHGMRQGAAGAAAAANAPVRKAEQPTVDTSLGAAAIALSLVMAGSGDLSSFRLLRVLRRRIDGEGIGTATPSRLPGLIAAPPLLQVTSRAAFLIGEPATHNCQAASHHPATHHPAAPSPPPPPFRTPRYGFHMAISMAIGFLFLGGGRLTLGTSKAAVAALLASVFPRFPLIASDGRYHLQALRHLYVLAVEARCLEAVDVETGEAALVPLSVQLREGGAPLRLVTPCPLPPVASIATVEVGSPRYWTHKLDLAANPEHAAALRRRLLWVKRKTGHLSYAADPIGLSSIFCRPFGAVSSMELVHTLSSATAVSSEVTSSRASQTHASRLPTHAPHPRMAPPPPTPPPPFAQREQLLRTFSNTPTLRVFSRHFCDAIAPHSAPFGAAAPDAPALAGGGGGALPSFCASVLYECLTQEKAEAITPYLLL